MSAASSSSSPPSSSSSSSLAGLPADHPLVAAIQALGADVQCSDSTSSQNNTSSSSSPSHQSNDGGDGDDEKKVIDGTLTEAQAARKDAADLTTTANKALAFKQSGSKVLDVFYQGMLRGAGTANVQEMMHAAWQENPKLALQVVMHGRDCRKGKGERQVVVDALLWLRAHKPRTYVRNLHRFLELGYFKDLLNIAQAVTAAQDSQKLGATELIELELFAYHLRQDQAAFEEWQASQSKNKQQKLADGSGDKKVASSSPPASSTDVDDENKNNDNDNDNDNDDKKTKKKKKRKTKSDPSRLQLTLAAKWAPSEHGAFDKGSKLAKRMANLLFPNDTKSRVKYRKMLSGLRARLKIVEVYACANQWDRITFEHVPAKAHKNLRKAFRKHQPDRYEDYLGDIASGKKTIKSAGLQPHELASNYIHQLSKPDDTIEAQWEAMREELRKSGSFRSCVSVVDVSGSMSGEPMQVAIALGILGAQLTEGVFANRVITFDTNPTWHTLQPGTLHSQVRALKQAPWGYSTDIVKVFDMVLAAAVSANARQEDMPSSLFIFSDMQFDVADKNANKTTFEVIRSKFRKAGYDMPLLVFWNVRGGGGKQSPVKVDENGTCLVSGYSGQLLKLFMGKIDIDSFSPYALMVKAVQHYECDIDPSEL